VTGSGYRLQVTGYGFFCYLQGENMDFSTVFGVIAFVALIFTGIATNQITSSLFNVHGVFVVLGGVFVAMLVSSPLNCLVKAVTELKSLMFKDEAVHLKNTLPVLVALAEQCRMKGISALKDADRKLAGGFLGRVSDAALDSNDYKFVKTVIEQEINQAAAAMSIKTCSIRAPYGPQPTATL